MALKINLVTTIQSTNHDLLSFVSPEPCRKDQKKVDKLAAQIPYHEGRGNLEEVTKIKDKIGDITEKARESFFA